MVNFSKMSAKEELTEEEKKAFDEVVTLLEGIINDRSVPRNIKRIAQRGIDEIQNNQEDSPGIMASNVMYTVGDLSQDPNCPFHTRTTIYRITSLLESIKD
jgi:uncharacterized protein (UPF0147 family)